MNKRILAETIDNLPEDFTLDELIERLIVMDKIEKGQTDHRDGKSFSHEEVKEKLSKWLK